MTPDTMNKSAAQLAFARLSSIRMYFYQWALKWHYGNTKEDLSKKPDLPIVICVLQAMGFKLREFERKDQPEDGREAVSSENIKITMECGSSKMTAVLDMNEVQCTCQENAEVNNGSLWSVSGTGPVTIEETGSNLLPDVPKETMQAVQEIISRIIKVINAKGEVSSTEFKDAGTASRNLAPPSAREPPSPAPRTREGLVRSYTDVYQQAHMESRVVESNLSKYASTRSVDNAKPTRQLQRQGTYELPDLVKAEDSTEEPRLPPPRISGSPERALGSSFGQLSLQSDEEVTGLADYVLKAHQILSSAVKFIKKNIPGNSSFNLDDSGNAKPTIQQMMSANSSANSSFSVVTSPRTSVNSHSGSTSSLVSRGTGSTNSLVQPLQRTQTPKPAQQQQQRSIPKLGAMPRVNSSSSSGLIRDRSSSFSSAQRPVFSKSVNSSGANKRNTSLSLNGSALGQRTASTSLKPPSSGKLAQPRSVCNQITERSSLQPKRRVVPSPNTSLTVSSSKPKEPPQRVNVSLIKPPTASRHINSSISSTSTKFGFILSKK